MFRHSWKNVIGEYQAACTDSQLANAARIFLDNALITYRPLTNILTETFQPHRINIENFLIVFAGEIIENGQEPLLRRLVAAKNRPYSSYMQDLNITIESMHTYIILLEGRIRNMTDLIGTDQHLRELHDELQLLRQRLRTTLILFRNLHSYLQRYQIYITLYEEEARIAKIYAGHDTIQTILTRANFNSHTPSVNSNEFPNVAYILQIDHDIRELNRIITALPNEAWAIRRSAAATTRIVTLQQRKSTLHSIRHI